MAGSFALDLSKFAEKCKVRPELIVKKVVFDIFSDIVMKTPVDTGRARGGWQIGRELGTGQTNLLDKSGSAAIGKAAQDAASLTLKARVVGYIYNNVEYIKALEDGHSKQAPAGMVKTTLVRWQNYIEKANTSL